MDKKEQNFYHFALFTVFGLNFFSVGVTSEQSELNRVRGKIFLYHESNFKDDCVVKLS